MKEFFCYSLTSKAYKVFNKRTLVVEESIHGDFDDSLPRWSSDDVNNVCADLDEFSFENNNKEQKEKKRMMCMNLLIMIFLMNGNM